MVGPKLQPTLAERLRVCADDFDAMPSNFDARAARLDHGAYACREAADALEALSAENAKLTALVREMLDNLKHCSLEADCCHWGERVSKHSDPMSAGHTPVDMGWTAAESWIAKAEAILAALKEPRS